MFRHSPIFGVGARQFVDHHFLTAHNSYVLTLAELGFPGLVLFVSVCYLSVKSLLVGLRELRDVPGAEVATIWGMSLLASMAGVLFQFNTLSLAYHSMIWIFFGLVGAWCSAIRYHRPDFRVRMSMRDFIVIVLACVAFVLVVLPLFLKAKGEL
jgi:O-antigen ligase